MKLAGKKVTESPCFRVGMDESFGKMKKYNNVLNSCIVQKYIADPMLLTDRCKFDQGCTYAWKV